MTLERRVTDIYIIVMLLVFPLFTGIRGYEELTASKYLFFVGTGSAWLIFLLLWRLYGLFVCRAAPKKPGPVSAAALIFMLACALSAALSPYGAKTLVGEGRYDGLITLLLYGGIFLGVSRTAAPRFRYLCALGVSTVLCCCVAVLQLLGINALWLFPGGLDYYDSGLLYSGAFLGTIGNTNLLSAFLCLGVPAFCSAFVCSGSRLSSLFLVPAVLGAAVLTASGVAGGAVAVALTALLALPLLVTAKERLLRTLLLALALLPAEFIALGLSWQRLPVCALAVLVVLALYLAARKLPEERFSARQYRRFFIAAELFGLVFAAAALYFYPGESGTLYELSRVMHGEVLDSFGSHRIEIWRRVLELVPERPLFGGGPGTLPLRLELGYSRYVPETDKTLSVYVDNAHNEYLGYLVNTGIAGLGAYLALMALSVRSWIKDRRPGALPLALGVICCWIQGLFGLGLCVTAPVMWIMWALSCGRGTGNRNADSLTQERILL